MIISTQCVIKNWTSMNNKFHCSTQQRNPRKLVFKEYWWKHSIFSELWILLFSWAMWPLCYLFISEYFFFKVRFHIPCSSIFFLLSVNIGDTERQTVQKRLFCKNNDYHHYLLFVGEEFWTFSLQYLWYCKIKKLFFRNYENKLLVLLVIIIVTFIFCIQCIHLNILFALI